MPDLASLGWSDFFESQLAANPATPDEYPARVVTDAGPFCQLWAAHGEATATVAAALRDGKAAARRPVAGDWVVVRDRGDGARLIVRVLDRRTALLRRRPGRSLQVQALAANLDIVFVVTAIGRDFSPRRVERALVPAWDSGARPVVLLTKIDLAQDLAPALEALRDAAPGVSVHPVSGLTGDGLSDLLPYLQPASTVAFIGSSGVGKSTLLNRLAGEDLQRTRALGASSARGRHTTTGRQLFRLPAGALVIDTPGIRELQLWDPDEGIVRTFADVETLAETCRFRDCTHEHEPGCAVREAVEGGRLDASRVESYRKLAAERRFREREHDVHARIAELRKWKRISKVLRRDEKRSR